MSDPYSHFTDPFRSELSKEGLPSLQDESGCKLLACASFIIEGQQLFDGIAVKCFVCKVTTKSFIGEGEEFDEASRKAMVCRVMLCEYWKKLPKNRDTL